MFKQCFFKYINQNSLLQKIFCRTKMKIRETTDNFVCDETRIWDSFGVIDWLGTHLQNQQKLKKCYDSRQVSFRLTAPKYEIQ